MAHNLEITNCRASFAYANGRPGWHGLGQAIPPGMEHSDTVAELAGLNRRVVLAPLYTMVDGQPVELQDKFATVYEDTGFVLGVVGSRYTVVQNVTAFRAIDRWLADGRVKYETAGALDEGRKVFIHIRIDEDFTIAGTDPITPYALVTNSHDGSSGTLNAIVLRLTFAGDVSAESVIQHLLETFNDDGSLVDAVVERTQAAATPERTTGR